MIEQKLDANNKSLKIVFSSFEGYCYARYRVDIYPEGLPCRSNVLPETQRLIFSQRRDEKIVRECEVACPVGKAVYYDEHVPLICCQSAGEK